LKSTPKIVIAPKKELKELEEAKMEQEALRKLLKLKNKELKKVKVFFFIICATANGL
jgi:hypothetical protein